MNFSISGELVSPNSKAGQLFQKRRAKSEEPAETSYIKKYDRSHFSLLRPLQRWSEDLEPENNGPQIPCRLKDMIHEYEVRASPYYTGIGLGNIDYSEEISTNVKPKGWNKKSSAKGEFQGEGSRTKWSAKSSSSRFGPKPFGGGRKFGSVPALHSPPLVGPITDF